MSILRTVFGLRQTAFCLAGSLSLLTLSLVASPAQAKPPRYPDVLPLSQVKPGMTGYGLTTFKGTTISRFQVTVIGILKKENAGHDLILIRMKGGPITERGANLIHGMSGSPIYIHDKIVGAFSMGENFPKEPVGMVTPIEDMLEAWDPDIPQVPSYFQPAEKKALSGSKPGAQTGARWQPDNRERVAVLPHPIVVGNRRIDKLVLNARPDDPRRSTGNVAVLHRATSLLSVSGISERDRVWLQKLLDERGYAITVAAGAGSAGRAPGFKGVPLRPGSAFGTWLATGDVEVGGTGTITYRRGNRILGFGHPLLGLGALEAAITSSYIVDVFSGYETSHYIAVAGPVVGTLRQDRDFSVSAEVGHQPHLVPFDITVHDATTHRTKTFHDDVFLHPDLTAVLLRLVAREAISRAHDVPGDVMARVTTTVDAGEVGKVTRTNTVFDADDIASTATQDLGDITNIVSGNPFYPLPIHSARMTVDISSGHNTATLERIFLKQGHYEPGDTLDIGVVLKPYRQDPVLKTVSLKIPADTPTGRYQLLVRGGTATVVHLGPFIIAGGSPEPETPPVNVGQMVSRLNQRETNTDLVARLIFNSVAPAIEGEKLSQLPPNLSALMRSDRNSGVRLERDEVRSTLPAGYVVSGTQQLFVSVVRKSTQEVGNGSPSPSTTTLPGIPPPSLPGGASINDANTGDDNDPTTGDAAGSLTTESMAWQSGGQNLPPAKEAGKREKGKGKRENSKGKAGAPPADADKAQAAAATAPTTPPPSAAEDKPVGPQLQSWRQTARADFSSGKFSGASVTAEGELRLTSSLRRLASTTETYIWALVPDSQGDLYAGTGTGGKILKIDRQGKIETFTTLPVVSIQSLALGKDGTLWAGSGVQGRLYRIQPDGSFTLAATLPEKYLMALAQDSKGDLFIGPGDGGTIYKLGGKDAKPVPYFKSSADRILSLAVDAQDNLYAGTGPEGILYKITPEGKSSVLFDARENSITALAVDSGGAVYAGTGPKGMLYRIASDGTATTVYDKASAFYTALRIAPDGSLYASTVNAIYHILPSSAEPDHPVVQPLDNPREVDFLTLALLPDGTVAAGTGNVGEIYASSVENSAPRSGTYESVVHDAKLKSRWGSLRWDATLPAGSGLRIETRTGNVAEPDSTWSPWTPVQPDPDSTTEGTIASPSARFIQYRMTLAAGPGAAQPAVREVTIDYMPRNAPPTVTLQAPVGGERWSKTQTIRWNASDPNNNTLTYTLFYSSDGGATWKPLPTAKSDAKSDAAKSAAPAPATSVETLSQQLDAKTSNMPPALKQMILDNYRRRLEGGGQGALKETSKSWDTTVLPDGAYQIKVVASDRLSNPTDPQTGETISEPFLIVNSTPQISLPASPIIGPDKSVAIAGDVTQALIAVTAVQYRIDGGDWIAATAKDGLFDSSHESFAFVTLPLPSGKHTVEVEAFNAAGAKATQKVDVQVP
ncbi:MAG TPA: SpoIVB peptidase S55 domain-containing protein [Chthonomonadaceae bacterium]|nr:SpoIVB peptidase S55 domain-containing protein [Chthonomonadaceae bacterium]